MGVLHRIIFSHTPDEAMSGGLAKACVPRKNYSVPEKPESLLNIKQNEKSTCIYERGVWSEKLNSFATMGKFGKEDGQLQEPLQVHYKMP